MDKICLYGASGHGKVVKDIAGSKNKEVMMFFDDNSKIKELNNVSVLTSEMIDDFKKFKFIISIGNNEIRKRVSQNLDVNFATLIHKTAIISNSTFIDEGTVIMSSVVVNSDSSIGKHCILNTSSVVEHDCKIHDYVHVSPNVTITGGVYIGEGTHVGAGAIIIPNLKIGKWVTIGAGAVIIKDVPDYAVVVGNPGSIIKYNKQ